MGIGKLKLMFDQETEFGEYINSFFLKNPCPRISWIHDVDRQDYQRSASALLEEAERESNREIRQVYAPSVGHVAI